MRNVIFENHVIQILQKQEIEHATIELLKTKNINNDQVMKCIGC